MLNQPTTYSRAHRFYSVLMMLALAWLTISLPFVYQGQLEKQSAEQQSAPTEDVNPFGNATEEKTASNTLSEYLHDLQVMEPGFVTLTSSFKLHNTSAYEVFHPELNCPPPEA
jgi:hypothetical protein